MRIAPGIHRLGNGLANSYLLEESGQVSIVDAGGSGYWRYIPEELAAMGRTLADVRAVLLTHAHSDHIGFAERMRRDRGVPVLVHELDAALARGEVKLRQSFAGARIVPVLRFIAYALRHGMLSTTPIAEVSTFADGATLDVPGAPRVIHVPGHTEGSAALHVTARDALFVGDAFVTYNALNGSTGPQISPFTADVAGAHSSLTRLERIDARLALPGHGEPWADGVAAAIGRVRSARH